MPARGLFITVEGGEGVGKTTNITLLANYLTERGVDLVTTREPGGTQLGEDIRSLLLQPHSEPISIMAELLLIFAARAQHIREVIEPALSQGKWVLCDRFTDATYAYQCGGRGIQSDLVNQLERLVQNGLCPDRTILMDAPVEVGMSRARDRGALDRFERESPEFFERVRASYLQLANANGERYHILDVGRPLEDVQSELLSIANDLMSLWLGRQQNLC